jgi:hypothetical protein
LQAAVALRGLSSAAFAVSDWEDDEQLPKPSGNPSKQAAESALISALTTVPQKRELFAKHAEHLNTLATEVERAMAAANREATDPNLSIARLNAGCVRFLTLTQCGDRPGRYGRSRSFDTSPSSPSKHDGAGSPQVEEPGQRSGAPGA